MRGAPLKWSALIVVVSLLLMVASLLIGTESVSVAVAWQQWQRGEELADAPELNIFLQMRLPRTLAAILAGAGLALAGCAFQALLRNPLATPYTLGIANASALGAWSSFIMADFGWFASGILGLPSKQVFAFLFAGGDVLLVYLLAARRRRSSPALLLLAGVTIGMLANSGIMLSRYLAQPDRLVAMDRWLLGGVDVLGYHPVLMLAVGVIPCAAILLAQAPKFDQFGFDAEMAAGRGVSIARLQIVTFFIGSLLTAMIVSEVGPIGFVGLIVPHVVRMFTGARHRLLMPMSLLVGGAFLCACDIIARKILPGETPIGIVTIFIGGPFFLYLLMRRKFTDWE